MAINPDQVIILESERLTDEDDGGGRATGREVTDGQVNNLFEDVSRLDRTVGDVALRKVYVGVNTDNQDLYLGAHAIIAEAPEDPRVSIVIFEVDSEAEERASAQDRLESFVVQGSSAKWELLGNQYKNQRQIIGIQREEVELPAAGDVFLLDNGTTKQFVRLTEVEDSVETFTVSVSGGFHDFRRRRMVLSISAPLEDTFGGGEAHPTGTKKASGNPYDLSDVFTTEVADAARYWGISKLAAGGSIGDTTVNAASIYAQLVPSSQTEQALVDQSLGFIRRTVRPVTKGETLRSTLTHYKGGTAFGDTLTIYMAMQPVPGSIVVTSAGGSPGMQYSDDGFGNMIHDAGPARTVTLDYEQRKIVIKGGATWSGDTHFHVDYVPGTEHVGRAESRSTEITIGTQGYNYTENLAGAKPRPGTMVISYMVQGKWYDVTDPGNGVLEGYGAGSINFSTGSVLVSLLEKPDIGSKIIFSYLADIDEEFTSHIGSVPDALPETRFTIEEGVAPGSLTVTYTAGGQTKTITDDSAGGLTGDGTGTITYATGEVEIRPLVLPDDGTDYDLTYDVVSAGSEQFAQADESTGILSGTIPNAPLQPGSISFTSMVNFTSHGGDNEHFRKTISDNGAGGFIGATGTIDYATGVFSVEYLRERTVTYYTVSHPPGQESITNGPYTETVRETNGSTSITAKYQEVSAGSAPSSTSHTPGSLTLAVVDTGDDYLLENSLVFGFAGKTYFDRDGILYQDHSVNTGAATAVGSVDYSAGEVTLESWTGGSAPGLTVYSGMTASAVIMSSRITLRTPGAPLRPESMQITATDAQGNLITATANADGDFIGPSISGNVNVETGIAEIWFTTDDQVTNGASDVAVFPNGRYNAVLLTYLPLDADLIGLDPVRLPADGRVPIFRRGDVVVLGHTATTDAGTPTNGQVVGLARDHQAEIRVEDANGVAMDPAQYSVDLLSGTVTFANPVLLQDASLAALTPPLAIKDRVEHMTVINEVDITGDLSLNAPLGHDFPAGESFISSALLWGDLNSRYTNFFKQKSWSSSNPNWGNSRSGDDTSASYNDVDNPIEIANRGAITEKWALVFTSQTTFNIVGQTLGIIGTGRTDTDCAPVNPNNGFPYFIVRAAGWGAGWASGNVVRFDTEGCLGGLWIARTVLSGNATVEDDQFILQTRGDAD